MTLDNWAARWGLPAQAMIELAQLTIASSDLPSESKSEAFVQSKIRLEAASASPRTYLWRNQVGAGSVVDKSKLCPICEPLARRPIRWGLANDSSQINKVIKSADLIGGRSLLITQAMVGSTVLQFLSRECKAEDWRFRGTLEENAQLAWATLINSLGGDARFVTGPGSL